MMRHLIALLLVAAPAFAAAPDLVKVETSMWDMWRVKDAKSFGALLADDLYDVYLHGRVVYKAELIKNIASDDLLDYKLSPMQVVKLSPDVTLLLYRAHVKGRAGGKVAEYDVDVTSAWGVRGGRWKSVFYRENLVPAKTPW